MLSQRLKANNMPNDTIDEEYQEGCRRMRMQSDYEHVTYEGYGPNGTAIIVEALTDNKNRTAANVRDAFTKGKGNVGTPGMCILYV